MDDNPLPLIDPDMWFEFLCRKYIQRADQRQREMGLTYTNAETHDLAKEISNHIARYLSGVRP
jgi:hypothetical protein